MKWNKLRTWCKERLLRLKKPFIIVGCMWFVACIAGFFLNCLFTYHFKFRLDINLLVDGKTYLYALLLSAIALTVALAYYYKHYWLKNSKKIIQGDERDNDVATNLEQAHFQTDGEVDKNYAKISYAELPKTNLVGIPIRAVDCPHPGTFKCLIGFLYHFREIFVGIFRLPQSVAHGETKIFHLFSGGRCW